MFQSIVEGSIVPLNVLGRIEVLLMSEKLFVRGVGLSL
jgi:hypothetical protein